MELLWQYKLYFDVIFADMEGRSEVIKQIEVLKKALVQEELRYFGVCIFCSVVLR